MTKKKKEKKNTEIYERTILRPVPGIKVLYASTRFLTRQATPYDVVVILALKQQDVVIHSILAREKEREK